MTDDATEEVSLIELIQLAIADREREFHVAFPAKVESYDASKQTVDCVPQLNRALPDGNGNWSTEKLPKLAAVPVCFPRAGGFFVSFPIQKGDYVMVVCSDRNIGAWSATGNQGDPGDLGMHTLDGAVAIPGVYPSNSALSDASGSTMKLGKDGASAAQIELTDALVKLGGGDQFVALANKVLDELNKIQTAHNNHVHVLTIVGTTGTAAQPVVTYTPASVAAQNVKAT